MKKAIAKTLKKLIEAWNTHDAELLASVSSKKVIRNGNGKREASNREEYSAVMGYFHTAFPDLKIILDDIKIKGRKAFLNWTATGTHKGALGDNPPTGKKVKVHGFSVWTFKRKGKALREDAFFDNLEMYQQLGYTLKAPVARKRARRSPAAKRTR